MGLSSCYMLHAFGAGIAGTEVPPLDMQGKHRRLRQEDSGGNPRSHRAGMVSVQGSVLHAIPVVIPVRALSLQKGLPEVIFPLS